MSIVRHPCIWLDKETSTAYVAFEGLPPDAMDHSEFLGPSVFVRFGIDETMQSLCGWNLEYELNYTILPLVLGVDQRQLLVFMTSLVQAQAFPDTELSFMPEAVASELNDFGDSLNALLSSDIITELNALHGKRRFRLTPEGMRRLTIVRKLRRPQRLLRPPSPTNMLEWSRFQFLVHLREQGWTCEYPNRRRIPPYLLDGSSAKTFYSTPAALRDGAIPISYLHVLSRTDELKGRGVLQIEHLKPVKYYNDMLEGNVAVPAICDAPAMASIEDEMYAALLEVLEDADNLPADPVFPPDIPSDPPPLPPPATPPVVDTPRRPRIERDKIVFWRFTIARVGGREMARNAWEARCGCHTNRTDQRPHMCRKRLQFGEDEVATQSRLLQWCLSGLDIPFDNDNSRTQHRQVDPKAFPATTLSEMIRRIAEHPYVVANPCDELDSD